jgi:hypothetical protein
MLVPFCPGSESARRLQKPSEVAAIATVAAVLFCDALGLHRGWQACPGPCGHVCFTVVSRRPHSSRASRRTQNETDAHSNEQLTEVRHAIEPRWTALDNIVIII